MLEGMCDWVYPPPAGSSWQEEVCHGAALCIGGIEVQSRKIMFQAILKMHITNSWVYPDPQFVKYYMPTASLRCIEKKHWKSTQQNFTGLSLSYFLYLFMFIFSELFLIFSRSYCFIIRNIEGIKFFKKISDARGILQYTV